MRSKRERNLVYFSWKFFFFFFLSLLFTTILFSFLSSFISFSLSFFFFSFFPSFSFSIPSLRNISSPLFSHSGEGDCGHRKHGWDLDISHGMAREVRNQWWLFIQPLHICLQMEALDMLKVLTWIFLCFERKVSIYIEKF